MKTIKKMIVVVAVVTGTIIAVHVSKSGIKNVNSCLKESTHQGYRSMVADYIF